MDWLRGVQYSVVTSRWFPLALVLSMSVLHVGLLGFDYWAAARNEKDLDISRFLQRDLERPLFEPYGFCGAWTHYSAGQSADLGLNFPAYIGAILLHSAVNFSTTCVDALTTPRGHIVTTVFVPPLWFMVGLSIGRIAGRRWHPALTGRFARAFAWLGLLLLPWGILFLVFGFLGLFVSETSGTGRAFGLAFWMVYTSALSAERLGLWPFRSLSVAAGTPSRLREGN